MGTGIVLVGAAWAALVSAGVAVAGTVEIHDDSHVLDASRVQNEAATLPGPVTIYTTTKEAGDNAAFDRTTQSKVSGPDSIVVAINTQSRHLAVRTGPRSRVSQSAAQAAAAAFKGGFNNGDYTAGTLAVLTSMRSSVPAQGNGDGVAQPVESRSWFSGFTAVIVVLGVAVLIGAIIAVVIRRSRGDSGRRRAATSDYPQAPPVYDQPGYGAPGYGQPMYGPPARSGMNPMAAGAIGAVGGGLLGYELGRHQNDRDDSRREDYDSDGGGRGGGNVGGGGADSDFGDSSGGDNF